DSDPARGIRRGVTGGGSRVVRSVREYCHHRPSMRATRPTLSIAFFNLALTARISAGVVSPYLTQVSTRRSLGSWEPLAWRMKVRRIPRTPPNRPASKTTLSRGDACAESGGAGEGAVALVHASCANTIAAKST